MVLAIIAIIAVQAEAVPTHQVGVDGGHCGHSISNIFNIITDTCELWVAGLEV